MRRIPVIAISGHPGCGKTTLCSRIRTRFGVPVINYDDHETITDRSPAEIATWLGNGADYNAIDLGEMVEEIERLLSYEGTPAPRFILVDTLVGRAHAEAGRLIDFSVWIDVPADIALARKLRQAAAKAALVDDPSAFPAWLDAWLGHYERFISAAYRGQHERVRPLADEIIDGTRPEEEVLRALEASIRKALERLE